MKDIKEDKWGLVIVLAAFFIQVFAFGTSTAIGVYNIEFLNYFDNDAVGVSLIAAINWGFFLGTGPIVSFLMTKMSYCTVALIGSVLVVTGILLMPFLAYLPVMCFSFGILAGIGSCMVYIPSHVLSGLYFDRHRSLSTGVATSGSGLGAAIMPIVVGYLIQEYGWKGSLILVAGLNLHLLVFSALLRAPSAIMPNKHSVESKALATSSGIKHMELEKVVANESVPMLNDQEQKSPLSSASETANKSFNEEEENILQIGDAIVEKNGIGQTNNVRKSKEFKKNSKDADEDYRVLRHFYIFTDVGFDVYFVSNILWNVTGGVLLAFVPVFITERGIDPLNAAQLLTILGIGEFFGGLLGGLIGTLCTSQRQVQYVAANIALGICCAFIPHGFTFTHFTVILSFGGLSFGVVLGLLVIVLTDLIGPQSLGDGLGYLMLSNGVGAFSGPALAGYLKNATGDYVSAFYLAGAASIVAGLIMFVIPVLKSFFHRKSKPSDVVITIEVPDGTRF